MARSGLTQWLHKLTTVGTRSATFLQRRPQHDVGAGEALAAVQPHAVQAVEASAGTGPDFPLPTTIDQPATTRTAGRCASGSESKRSKPQ